MVDRSRHVFEKGHIRKFLVVVDDTPEVESALAFAANRVKRTGGRITLLQVIEPGGFQHWLGVKEIQREEEMNKAKAVFRLYRRKLKRHGFEHIEVEEVIREGNKAEEMFKLIAEDDDVAIIVLGASTEQSGPGPLITTLLSGNTAGDFAIPISIIPGNLDWQDIESLA